MALVIFVRWSPSLWLYFSLVSEVRNQIKLITSACSRTAPLAKRVKRPLMRGVSEQIE